MTLFYFKSTSLSYDFNPIAHKTAHHSSTDNKSCHKRFNLFSQPAEIFFAFLISRLTFSHFRRHEQCGGSYKQLEEEGKIIKKHKSNFFLPSSSTYALLSKAKKIF
jgi:hypothetical protein